MTLKELFVNLQIELNSRGEYLLVDGDAGPLTQAALAKYDVVLSAHAVAHAPPPPKTTEDFGAPWIFANLDLLGRTETDPELNARYVPEWKLEGLPGYTTLAGNSHAWCSVRENADKRKVGVKGTNSAGAASWSEWEKKCPYWFGATLDIKHAGGGRHVNDFLYWIDEANKIAACLGGNQGNKFSIASFNLSGNAHGHDEVVAGPRWSTACPDGRLVSRAEVLAKHPHLVVGASGSESTK